MSIEVKSLEDLSHCGNFSEDYLSELFKQKISVQRNRSHYGNSDDFLTVSFKSSSRYSPEIALISIKLTDDWKKNLYLKQLISLYSKVISSDTVYDYNFLCRINVSNTPNYKVIPSTNLDDLYSIDSLSEEEIGFLTILLLKRIPINSKNKDEILGRVRDHIEYFKNKDVSNHDGALSYINIQYSINGLEQHDMRKLLHYCYWNNNTSVVDKDYELTSKLLSIFIKHQKGELAEEEKNILIKDWKVDSSIFAKTHQQLMTSKQRNFKFRLSDAFYLPISTKKYRDYLYDRTTEEYLYLLNHVSKNSSAGAAINISDKVLSERAESSNNNIKKTILQEANDLYVLVFDKFKDKEEMYFICGKLHSVIFDKIRYVSYENAKTKPVSSNKSMFVHQCYQVIKSIIEGERYSFSEVKDVIELVDLIFSTKNWIRDSASAYFVLDKLYSTLGVEETGRILYDVVTSDVVLTPLQWDKFLEKHEEFRDMPAVWWVVSIK